MTLNEYQLAAMSTCTPSCDNEKYMLNNLVAEVGEICGKIAKATRKQEPSDQEGLKLELGDVLWQVAGLANVWGFTLDEVAKANLSKLAKRKQNGTIIGDGDHR